MEVGEREGRPIPSSGYYRADDDDDYRYVGTLSVLLLFRILSVNNIMFVQHLGII